MATGEVRVEGLVADLVVAVLSVNGWTLEKTFSIHDGLCEQGLFDVERLPKMPPTEVFDRSQKAEYSRGEFMIGLLADRILTLARALEGEGKEPLEQLVTDRDTDSLDRSLLDLKGVGPAVVSSFKLLSGIE